MQRVRTAKPVHVLDRVIAREVYRLTVFEHGRHYELHPARDDDAIHSVLEAIPGVESLQRAERRAESQVRGRARQPRMLQQLLRQ